MLTVVPLHRNGGPIARAVEIGSTHVSEAEPGVRIEELELVCPYSVHAGRSVVVAWLRDELIGWIALMLHETETTAFGERCRRYSVAARVGDDTYAASFVRHPYLAPPGELMRVIGRPLARSLAESIVDAWFEEGDR